MGHEEVERRQVEKREEMQEEGNAERAQEEEEVVTRGDARPRSRKLNLPRLKIQS